MQHNAKPGSSIDMIGSKKRRKMIGKGCVKRDGNTQKKIISERSRTSAHKGYPVPGKK